MIKIILAYIGSFMTKFNKLYWNGYEIRLLHPKENIRRLINWIPYFWDDEIAYTLVIGVPKKTGQIDDVWIYKWRLLDLEGNRLNQGTNTIDVTNTKWMRRYFGHWTSGKQQAVILGNLSPNKNYIVKMEITNGNGEKSGDTTMATFSTKDRSGFYMQIFLIIFSIVTALYFSMATKGCGI